MDHDTPAPDRLLSLLAVCSRANISPKSLFKEIEAGRFPRPVMFAGELFWIASKFLEWLYSLEPVQELPRPPRQRPCALALEAWEKRRLAHQVAIERGAFVGLAQTDAGR